MSLEISELDVDIQDIITKSDLTPKTKENLTKTKIILLPASFSVSYKKGDFPSDTPNFFKFLRIEHPEISVTLFENGGEEKIQALHAAEIILPPLYYTIQDYSIDLIIGIIGAYLYDKFKGDPDLERKRVKTEIFAGEKGSTKIIHIYSEGPVSGIKEIKKLFNSYMNKKK